MQDWLNDKVKKSRKIISSNPRRYYGGIKFFLGNEYNIKWRVADNKVVGCSIFMLSWYSWYKISTIV